MKSVKGVSRRENVGYFFVIPALAFFAIIILYPLVEAIRISFSEVGLARARFVGLVNYKSLLALPDFLVVTKNTFIYAGTVAILRLLVGLLLALCLNTRILARRFFRTVIALPWVIAGVITGLTWRWLYNDEFGLINSFLRSLGIIEGPYPWLSNSTAAMPAVIIASVWRGFPFCMFMLLAALQMVSEAQYDAAKIDGANRWQLFWYITTPNILYTVLVVLLLNFIWTFSFFDVIFVMTGGGPGDATKVLSISVYENAFEYYKFGFASAFAVTMFLMLMCFVVLYLWLIRKSERI